MKKIVVLARILAALSVLVFAAGLFGGVYFRLIQPVSSITAAWRDAISTLTVASVFAIFLATIAVYLQVEANSPK